MTATSKRLIVPAVAFALAIVAALVFAFQHVQREAPAAVAAAAPKPAASAKDERPAALAAVQAEASAVVSALAGTPAPKSGSDDVPSFDIARIEPSGEAVIAGRATPGTTVELLRNGEPHDRVVVDQSGQFAMTPPRLPPGTYDLTLRARQPDGKQTVSKQSVAVALAPSKSDAPVVALITPNKPSVVLSQPTAAKQAAGGAIVAEAVEVEAGGKLHVSGRARPGASVRFYLNNSYVASVTAAADGRFAVTINEGVAPGNYRVRLDEMEQNSTAVRARVEVPFNVPETIVTASVAAQAKTSKPQDAVVAAAQPRLAAAGNDVVAAQSPASSVVVPKIATTTVARGDNLWQISRLTYGDGMRYAVIFNANREHIRDPDLIYPGQVFVLPTQ